MSEKLIIRNFGPITNVDLDLRKVNVLIGDQGTGKSTVAKVLSLLKNAAYNNYGELSLTVDGKKVESKTEIAKFKNESFNKEFQESVQAFELKNYFNFDSYIYFDNELCNIEYKDSLINFVYKGESKGKNTDLNYFIPAFRDAYILLRENYPAILNAKATLPSLLNWFGQVFNNNRKSYRKFDFRKVINVEYEYSNGNDIIILEDGKQITFEESSSAINSVVPMLVVFDGVINEMSDDSFIILHRKNCPFITIEESELNCYPLTQKKLVEHLIEKIKFRDYQKSNEYYCNLLLTTHSPYILTSINNLMYAYNVGKEHFEETDKIIPYKNWLNPNDVSAYRLNEGGVSEDIFDKEESLIKAEKIDEVSTSLNKAFNDLINIEMGVVNEKR